MPTPHSHLFNAVILPVSPDGTDHLQRFQVSASRNDRGVARYLSPAWSERELRTAFTLSGTTAHEFEELLRGNRRASGKRDPRRLLFSQSQLEQMGLLPEAKDAQSPALQVKA